MSEDIDGEFSFLNLSLRFLQYNSGVWAGNIPIALLLAIIVTKFYQDQGQNDLSPQN